VAFEQPSYPPRLMTRHHAAYYTGVSLRQFDKECAAKLWPSPIKRGEPESLKPRLTWDKGDIDRVIDAVLKGDSATPVATRDESDDFASRREAARLRRSKNG